MRQMVFLGRERFRAGDVGVGILCAPILSRLKRQAQGVQSELPIVHCGDLHEEVVGMLGVRDGEGVSRLTLLEGDIIG